MKGSTVSVVFCVSMLSPVLCLLSMNGFILVYVQPWSCTTDWGPLGNIHTFHFIFIFVDVYIPVYSIRLKLVRSTSTPFKLNLALGRPIQGRLLLCWLCRQVDSGMFECVRRSTFTWLMFQHIRPNPKPNSNANPNCNPNPNGKFLDISVPTLDLLKADVLQVDLAEQSTCCKSTIWNSWPCRRVDLADVLLVYHPQST